MEALKANLVSFTKLDRDRALQELESAVGEENVSSISEADLKFFFLFIALLIYYFYV